MFTISKEFAFSASHVLDGLPDGHPCTRLHGHNYTVEIVLEGPLDDAAMVLDYGALSGFRDWINDHLDHRHLNDVLNANPTAEQIAYVLFQVALRWVPTELLAAVRVRETPKTCAEYRP